MFSRFKGPDAIITQKHRIQNSPADEIPIFKKNTGSHSTIDMTNGKISFSQNKKCIFLDLSLSLFCKLSQLIIAVFSSSYKCGLKERTDESFFTGATF